MKPIQKIELLEQIGAELQSRMTYADLNIYLSNYGISPGSGTQNSYNSKRVYVKDLLATQSDEKLIAIAEELDIEHKLPPPKIAEPTFWKTGQFRLFLSHLSSFKKQTSNLQSALTQYGVSSFVAHEDIEPSREWQNEIEAALQTMDAIVPLLMPGFKESNWCDQELGFAVAKNVLVVPVRKGLDPYGFIGKYQGIQAEGKTIGQVAEAIFGTLVTSPRTKPKMLKALAFSCAQSSDPEEALDKLKLLRGIPELPLDIVSYLKERIEDNGILREENKFTNLANLLLKEYGLTKIGSEKHTKQEDLDDIPF